MNPFTQYKPWMIERYGEPLFRIPVEIASSCPHGRCAFCSENGSRAQQTQKQESPLEQAEEAIRFARRRYRAKKFMLYIQAFTADLTDPEQQRTIFQCLEKFEFDAVSIGTRPDCLPPTALDFLQQLQLAGHASRRERVNSEKHRLSEYREACPTKKKMEIWVELGVQTANDETLKRINRGHDWECSRQAILALAERGIHVAPHIILGLPNETADDWNRTAEKLAKLPLRQGSGQAISGIKIHNLHIMKGTALAENPPPVLNHWEYAEGLMDFLRRIPADVPVMRISTDTPDDQLIAPHWHLEKGQFKEYLTQQMVFREISQGDLTSGVMEYRSNGISNNPSLPHSMTPVVTADGSVTFFSKEWKEHYHTKAGARLEADKKFVEPSELASKLQTANLKLLDVCFGLGNNSLAALCANRADRNVCSTCEANTPICQPRKLEITALEMDKRVVRAASQSFQCLETDPVDWNQTLSCLLDGEVIFPNLGKIDLQFGDARYLIQNIEDNIFDVVFHDPFSSQRCPELWTVEFFKQLHRVMKPGGVLCTYSSAAPVRGAMIEAGFFIAETVPGHQMGNGTIAAKNKSLIESLVGPASCTQEPVNSSQSTRSRIREACPTTNKRKSIPYRDEFLCATSKAILRQRQEAVERFDA